MIRFLADENFNAGILRGLVRRVGNVEVVRVQDAGLGGADDDAVLAEGAREERVVLTPRPSELCRLHPDVDLALGIGLAKAPADRFDSAAELADALEAASRGRLEAPLRLRAQKLLARHPWGHDQLTPLGVVLPRSRP